MSIALSDTQIAQILTVSRPLQPQERTAFMAALFQDLLNRREEVGDGELGRTLRDLQHRYSSRRPSTSGKQYEPIAAASAFAPITSTADSRPGAPAARANLRMARHRTADVCVLPFEPVSNPDV
jgi:hypothetical protein